MDLQTAWAAYDGRVNALVFGLLDKLDLNTPSVLTRNLPFVANPTHIVSFILAYLAIVLIGVAYLNATSSPGKQKAESWWLVALVRLHNLFLIALSLFMCITTIYEAVRNKYSFWGQGYDASEAGMARVIYIFYISKLYEFADTMIMLLKGSTRQVSFLHVYHHASISIIWWVIAYAAPGGDAYFSCALNSAVHVVMYTYYLMATFFRTPETRSKYLFWGRYLTAFQMSQFAVNMGQAAYITAAPNAAYPKAMSRLLFVYMITLLGLFGQFYVKKHAGKGPKRVKDE